MLVDLFVPSQWPPTAEGLILRIGGLDSLVILVHTLLV